MITLKTKTPFNLVDDRQKSIGEHIIYLKADELIINNELVTLHGFYYYKKENIMQRGTSHSAETKKKMSKNIQSMLETSEYRQKLIDGQRRRREREAEEKRLNQITYKNGRTL